MDLERINERIEEKEMAGKVVGLLSSPPVMLV